MPAPEETKLYLAKRAEAQRRYYRLHAAEIAAKAAAVRRGPKGEAFRAKIRARYHQNWQVELARVHEWKATPQGRAARNRLRREHRLKYPERERARDIVKYAIKKGRLVRQPCEVCQNPKSQAHHDDYSKPLKVRWLCFKHHHQAHGHRHFFEEAS